VHAGGVLSRRILHPPDELVQFADNYLESVDASVESCQLAWTRLGRIMRELSTDQAFDVACHIVHRLPPGRLKTLGGAALAHFVRYHGGARLEWIEAEALRDRRFFTALSNMILVREELNPWAHPRLQALTGGAIRAVPRARLSRAYEELFASRKKPRRGSPARRPGKPSPARGRRKRDNDSLR
jgi:hypothetical protein